MELNVQSIGLEITEMSSVPSELPTWQLNLRPWETSADCLALLGTAWHCLALLGTAWHRIVRNSVIKVE